MSRERALSMEEKLKIRRSREKGVSIAMCASCFDVSVPTVYRALRELREQLGPEKLPRRQSARWHLTARSDSAKANEGPISNAS